VSSAQPTEAQWQIDNLEKQRGDLGEMSASRLRQHICRRLQPASPSVPFYGARGERARLAGIGAGLRLASHLVTSNGRLNNCMRSPSDQGLSVQEIEENNYKPSG
jgi:hypothetical protein